MRNLRKYGQEPFSVAVIHGGPGAAGEMAPVARELSARRGVLEPIQTATSLDAQVEELRDVLVENGETPLDLIGYSWGAWLGAILAARVPQIVRKLILVSSGPFEERYVQQLGATRKRRLSPAEKDEFDSVIDALGRFQAEDRDRLVSRLGTLAAKTDTYDPTPGESEPLVDVGRRGDIFRNVWRDASELRRNRGLLKLVGQVRCPVTAIHGDYDPHPSEGVRKPLAEVLPESRFVLLDNCGHTPWRELQAREAFYRILEEELQ
ncbi:MAG: alpha/beta hydrolase [Candidatus Latescibacteria bacterium]|jgi:pimeloyl-ACP methyl ester carboxylesterase|nr:alpha/beta hydrolase [Candidatus Latescibacterota bacterium]